MTKRESIDIQKIVKGIAANTSPSEGHYIDPAINEYLGRREGKRVQDAVFHNIRRG